MHYLTKPQKSIYNMEKFTGGSIATICSSMLREGKVECSVLQCAVNELYRLNDVLRTRIIETADGVMQKVSEYKNQEFEVLSFNEYSEFLKYAEKYAKQPIDIYGCLCDVKIVFVENSYGLLVKLHHIISDAWTMSLLARQFANILDGVSSESYQYCEYIELEQEYVESKRYQKDKTFFLDQFKKCDEVTYLSDKSSEDYNADRKTFVLSKEQTNQIFDIAERNDSSVFAVFMTLFGIYMSRIKMNAEKFYIGTPVLNRTGIKEQNTAGMFINTVPLLAEIDYYKTFEENLQATTDNIMAMLRHQHYNYEDLLAELRSQFNFTEKLYDVILSYQNAKTEAKGFKTEWHSCGMQTESLQIHIDDRDSNGILRINYDYRTDIFTEKEIEKINEYIFNLLDDAVNNKDKKVHELEILSANEKNTLLYDFNNTKADYPKDKCVHQLFEEQVLKTPKKEAVIACDKTLTYDELNKLSNRIANSLIKKGVKANDIVAFALPRTSYLIAVMFGILKSGAAYMPIDPEYPQDRIDYMLTDSGAKLFITTEVLKDLLKNNNENNPNVLVSQDDIYCALHTSGSTGKPKSALLTHKNIMAFLHANHRFYDGVDATVSVTVVTFDVFMQDTVLSIACGVKTILSSEEQIYDQIQFEKLFLNVKSALFFATPTKLKSYINQSNTKEFLNHIGVFVVGGEVFPNDLYELISDYLKTSDCYNGYGPTETTLCNACNLVPPPENLQRVRTYGNNHREHLHLAPPQFITSMGQQKQQFVLLNMNLFKNNENVVTLFEKQVANIPNKVALIACDKTLTYNELNKLSNRVANKLIEQGIVLNDIVAFALSRTSNLIVAILGILKTGAAYMPIDPDYPQDRIDFMLTDSGAKLLITDENVNKYISDNDCTPNIWIPSDAYCYCIYTSGSTGKPKGTLLYHKGIVNLVTDLNLYGNSSNIDKVGFLTTITFDVATQEILTALLNGFTGVLFPERKNTEIDKIIDYIEKYEVDIIYATPSYFDMLTTKRENAMRVLNTVSTVALAGEKFYLNSNVLELKSKYDVTFENQYGPAETHVITTTTTIK